jgi:uncharacterized protein (TIGR03437 family)
MDPPYGCPGIYHKSIVAAYTRGSVPILFPGGSADYATAVLPRDLELGSTSLTITTATGTSDPFPVTIDMYSPGLYGVFGHPGDPVAWSCPSRQGDFIRLNAVGLGPANPWYTVAMPSVTIGGKPATVTKSYLATPHYGGNGIFT